MPPILRSYQRPREKKPSRASTRMTIRMIQRMLTETLLLFAAVYF
jgi:hypothetical protein